MRLEPPGTEADERPLAQLLQHFTYKPGWWFRVERGALSIKAEVPDASDHGRTITLTFQKHLPPVQHMHHFDWQGWLFHTILEMERHEVQEFFRVDGRTPYDPHPELTAA